MAPSICVCISFRLLFFFSFLFFFCVLHRGYLCGKRGLSWFQGFRFEKWICFVVLFVQFQAYKRSVVVGDSDIPGSVVAYHHGQELVQAGTSPGYVVVLSLFLSLYRCLCVQDF